MMAAWDREDRRPVPPMLVDCRMKFVLRPSQVAGSDSPAASNPEPELWREKQQRMEQQRMAEEEWRYREREREREAAVRAEEEEMMRRREQQASNAGGKWKSNFVDPDDMVEEKVELSFENVAVAPPQKKKKKKKSLL
jgi:hypothetical protein